MRIAVLLALTLCATACAAHEDHAQDVTAAIAEYISSLPSPASDPRAGMMVGYVRVADDMMGSTDPVERHVDTMTLRQSCMQAAYGMKGGEQRNDALAHLAITPTRKARWWRYVVISTGRASIDPSEEACNF